MVCFINSDHVMFSREFTFCPFINCENLCTWMYAHRTKFERDSSLKYHHLNGETKHTSWKGQLLSWVDTSISANRIRHHAPFIVTSNISVSQLSLLTELIIDRSKHALPSKIRSCWLFYRFLSQIFNNIYIASTPGFEPGSALFSTLAPQY